MIQQLQKTIQVGWDLFENVVKSRNEICLFRDGERVSAKEVISETVSTYTYLHQLFELCVEGENTKMFRSKLQRIFHEDQAILEVLVPLSLLHLSEVIHDLQSDATSLICGEKAFGAMGLLYKMYYDSPTGFGKIHKDAATALDAIIPILHLRYCASTSRDSNFMRYSLPHKKEALKLPSKKQHDLFTTWMNLNSVASEGDWEYAETQFRRSEMYFKTVISNNGDSMPISFTAVMDDFSNLLDLVKKKDFSSSYQSFGVVTLDPKPSLYKYVDHESEQHMRKEPVLKAGGKFSFHHYVFNWIQVQITEVKEVDRSDKNCFGFPEVPIKTHQVGVTEDLRPDTIIKIEGFGHLPLKECLFLPSKILVQSPIQMIQQQTSNRVMTLCDAFNVPRDIVNTSPTTKVNVFNKDACISWLQQLLSTTPTNGSRDRFKTDSKASDVEIDVDEDFTDLIDN